MKKHYLCIFINLIALIFSVPSHAATLQLSVFENYAGDFSGSVNIELIDANTVITTFNNTSLTDGPVIESLHFELGAADWLSNPVWTNINLPGTNKNDIIFKQSSKPSGAPGGENIDWSNSHKSGATSYNLLIGSTGT